MSTAEILWNSIRTCTPIPLAVQRQFGIDSTVYNGKKPPLPDILDLIAVYATFLELYGPKALHEAFVDRRLPSELNRIIEQPHVFDWIQTASEPFPGVASDAAQANPTRRNESSPHCTLARTARP